MFLKYLIILIIIFENFNLYTTRNIDNNNNNNNNINNSKSDHKCLINVPTIYLEFDRKYEIIVNKTIDKEYFSWIEACCEGFKRSKYNWDKCVPACDNCEHGICIEPGVCECYPNYVKNHLGKCVLTCPVSCDNGKCKADGTCKCNNGYKLDETERFCKPICERADYCEKDYNQYCSAPNNCSCLPGYHINRDGCVPRCKHNCGINGNCDAPNKCRCHSGSIPKHGICQDSCYQICDNGLCVSKNRCICFSGFQYDQRTTTCIPQKHVLKKFKIEEVY